MNTKEDIIKDLFALQRFGIKPGLDRTIRILEERGNPHRKFKSIHVAGTNGKGSVCAYLASMFTESGMKTGLYTSPHLVNFNERIRIDGVCIPYDELLRLAEAYLPFSEKYEATFFEITTAMAFEWFAMNNVDVVITETGMGGRFDSTNVLAPDVTVITPISMDHSEYLGNTIEEIAMEKAGIIKENCPVIISDNNPELKDLFIEKAYENNSECLFVNDIVKLHPGEYNRQLTMSAGIEIEGTGKIKLQNIPAGSHQLGNLAAAVLAYSEYNKSKSINTSLIQSAVNNLNKNTGHFGRMEFIPGNPDIIIDSGHNPSSFKVLAETLENCGYKKKAFNLVFGAMQDKDIEAILKIIRLYCNTLIATMPNIERAESADNIASIANKLGYENISIMPNVEDAVGLALSLDKNILVAGSFYLAGEAVSVLKSKGFPIKNI